MGAVCSITENSPGLQPRPRQTSATDDSPGGGEVAEAEQLNRKTTLLEMPMWTKPEYSEMRFGFEVTMYIANR